MVVMSTRLEHAAADSDMSMAVKLGSDDPLERLRALKWVDQQVDAWLREFVAAARQRGASWSAIGGRDRHEQAGGLPSAERGQPVVDH